MPTSVKLQQAQKYNKAIAAAGVTIVAWVASLFGLDIPAEVQGSLIVVAVYFIPNR